MPLGFGTKSIGLSSLGFNISALISKGSIVNVDEDEILEFTFNPTEITRARTANWVQKDVAFRSHPRYQFNGGGPVVWTMSIYLNSIASGAQGLVNLLSLSENIGEDVFFLEALTYPLVAEESEIEQRRPPNAAFVWPGLANVPIVVLDTTTHYQKFNFLLQQMVTVVDITFAENPEFSVTSEEHRNGGATGLPGILGAILDSIPGASAAASAAASIL